jgi:hypothetical protein
MNGERRSYYAKIQDTLSTEVQDSTQEFLHRGFSIINRQPTYLSQNRQLQTKTSSTNTKNIIMTSSKNQREYGALSSYKRRYMGLNIICIREDLAEQQVDNDTIPNEFRLPHMSPTAPISFERSSKRPLSTIPSEIFIGSPQHQSHHHQEQNPEPVHEPFQRPSLHHRTDSCTISSCDEFPLHLIESPGSKRRLRNRALSDTDVQHILLALLE